MIEGSRYIIGIDLGTTNSAVAYVDTCPETNPSAAIRSFEIPQLTQEGLVQDSKTLPSFCYLAGEGEFPAGALDLPWSKGTERFVGVLAREHGVRVPTRLVQSAKSWLCNAAASRKDPILPVQAADASARMSPVESTAAYLGHLRDAWNACLAKGDPTKDFDEQEVVVTVPASFDEVARTLTVEAAKLAGYRSLTLLEEPQAAFYSWISSQGENWRAGMHGGESILVCDIGGGTSDFSLIRVSDDGDGFQRMAVGRHLLLGGDNIDAAIAHRLEQKLDAELDSKQWLALCHHARAAKEQLADAEPDAKYTAVIQGKGASVVAGTLAVEISAQELQELLLDGFFTSQDWDEAVQLKKTRGMRSMGLPYEDDPSITKQLASFLQRSMGDERRCPDYILFNGGSMKPERLQKAVLDAFTVWFETSPQQLSHSNLDLAVSRGAAYYGKVRRGLGVRIRSGSPRAYYLGVDRRQADGSVEHQALTVMARGREEGFAYEAEEVFQLTANTAVSFQVYSSEQRLSDAEGDWTSLNDEDFTALPPIQTLLRFGKKQGAERKIPAKLRVAFTEMGTLELSLQAQESEHCWKLEFQLRQASGLDDSLAQLGEERHDETFDASFLEQAVELIDDCFAGDGKPAGLTKALEAALEQPRLDWPPSVLRGLADALLKQAKGRDRSPEHQARWWNLVGFCLRPGYGYPLDDHRIKELWKAFIVADKVKKHSEAERQVWICCRRVAGGLKKGQQLQLAHRLMAELMHKKKEQLQDDKRSNKQELAEKIRALASLELIPIPVKRRVGNAMMRKIRSKESEPFHEWALARIGARHLLTGSVADVIPADDCAAWIDQLLEVYASRPERITFVLTQLARRCDQREVDVAKSVTDAVFRRCQSHSDEERLHDLLYKSTVLTHDEQERVYGEALPTGLMVEA